MDAIVYLPLSFVGLALTLTNDYSSVTSVDIVRSLLLFGVSVNCVFAFTSVYIQADGLLDNDGLIPVGETLLAIDQFLASRLRKTESVFDADYLMVRMLMIVREKFFAVAEKRSNLKQSIAIDIILSVVSLVYPHPLIYLYLYTSYYAIKRVGGRFYNFQWDALLLEVLLVSMLLALSYDHVTSVACVWLMKVLLFRLMFGSGVVKLCSNDGSWNKQFDAMRFHFLTQPLPTWLGMKAHVCLPLVAFKLLTVATLVVELIFPLLSMCMGYGTVNVMIWAAYIALQLSISACGYYGFFNYLTIAISSCLLDDSSIYRILEWSLRPDQYLYVREAITIYLSSRHQQPLSRIRRVIKSGALIILILAFAIMFLSYLFAIYKLAKYSGNIKSPLEPPPTKPSNSHMSSSKSSSNSDRVKSLQQHVEENNNNSNKPTLYQNVHAILSRVASFTDMLHTTFYVGSHYGLFANMTKIRNEITIEVSEDATVWRNVEFIAKPGAPEQPLKTIFPFFHLPRLDWVMWFIALRPSKELLPKWFWGLLISIMEADNGAILGLLHPTLNHDVFDHSEDISFNMTRKFEPGQSSNCDNEGDETRTTSVSSTKKPITTARTELMRAGDVTNGIYHNSRDEHTTSCNINGSDSGDDICSVSDSSAEEGVDNRLKYIRVNLVNYEFYSAKPANTTHSSSDTANLSNSGNLTQTKVDFVCNDSRSNQHGSDTVRTSDADLDRVGIEQFCKTTKYWVTRHVREILPPTAANQLYEMLDQYESREAKQKQRREAPSPESAADIIMRTMFNKLYDKSKLNRSTKTKQA